MPETTPETVAVEPTPVAGGTTPEPSTPDGQAAPAEPAAPPQPISAAEATRRENAVAAAARRQATEAAAEANAPVMAELDAFRKAAKDQERAELDAVERANVEAEEAKAEAQTFKAAAELAIQEKASAQKTAEIAQMLSRSATQVPGPYQQAVYETLAAAEEALTQESVDEATVAARAKFEADVAALMPNTPPSAIGSAANQPAAPNAAQLTPEQSEAALADLVERSQAGDPAAIDALMKGGSIAP